jgi:uncharacterized protein
LGFEHGKEMPKLRQKSIFVFLVIAYAVSWTIWVSLPHSSGVLYIKLLGIQIDMPIDTMWRALGNIGPGLAAIIVTLTNGRKSGLHALLRKLVPRLKDSGWIALALALPISAVMLGLCWTSPGFAFSNTSFVLRHWLLVFAFNLPLAPLWEEIGWRGYLLPNLQNAFTPTVASLVVGAIWGGWHTPLYADVVLPGSHYGVFPFLFFVLTIGASILFSWLFNISGENLFVTVFLHASFNATVLAILTPALAVFGIPPFLRVIVVIWVFDIALLMATHGGLSIQYGADRIPRYQQSA